MELISLQPHRGITQHVLAWLCPHWAPTMSHRLCPSRWRQDQVVLCPAHLELYVRLGVDPTPGTVGRFSVTPSLALCPNPGTHDATQALSTRMQVGSGHSVPSTLGALCDSFQIHWGSQLCAPPMYPRYHTGSAQW